MNFLVHCVFSSLVSYPLSPAFISSLFIPHLLFLVSILCILSCLCWFLLIHILMHCFPTQLNITSFDLNSLFLNSNLWLKTIFLSRFYFFFFNSSEFRKKRELTTASEKKCRDKKAMNAAEDKWQIQTKESPLTTT